MENSLLGQVTMEEAYNRIQELEEENEKLKEDLKIAQGVVEDTERADKNLKAHCNMLESENKLLKEECKARLEKIKELEK